MLSRSIRRLSAGMPLLLAALLAACGGGSDQGAGNSASQSAAVKAQMLPQQPAATQDVTSAPVDSDRAATSAASAATNQVYVVQLAEPPAAVYDGGIAGYAATRPPRGGKIDPQQPAVANYVAYLAARHDGVLRAAGNGRKLYSYGYVFNGFAAELSDAQAQQLAQTKGVVAVTKDTLLKPDTASTAAFLGLSGADGMWTKTGAQGENVVIGMIDSGIWPESESFSDRTGSNGNGTQDGKLSYQQIPGWHGKCTPGDQFNASNCNQKLIGARYYNSGWGGNAGISARFPEEYNSPRDFGGHGTHTSSTAGGNSGVTVTGPAAVYGKVTGMAPRARIAMYKVCWSVEPRGGCFGSDSVAAIDQAVADGVDVINFSISGTLTNFRDPVEIAFLNAAAAGVFVAASAGNSGPTTGTVAHPSPWITTVAAGTHNRSALSTLTTAAGATFKGASSAATAAGPASLVNADDAALPGAGDAARLCFSTSWNGTPALDPAKVAGKIVVCDRGTNDRVNKSLAVKEAGGIGMVLVNTSANSLNADFHSVPTVHLADTDRAAVRAAATAGASGTVAQATLDFSTPAPYTASFSSRGPLAATGSLLKPDIIAPGQDVLAAVAPPGNSGRSFDLYSGTSMSSPHIAGIAALFKQLHPDWSPMAIKSALMTTAGDVLDGPNTHPLVIFRQGAGHVRPQAALDPGLVFDSGITDWIGFLCGTQLPASYCTARRIPVVKPADFNVASVALGNLPGVQTVTRRVTNVGHRAATYTASVAGLAGFSVEMTPPSLTVGAGDTKSFTLKFQRTSATLLSYAGGQLTLSDGTHNVRLPVVVRPVAMGAPAEASGSYDVTFGYDGPFSATARGLVPATKNAATVVTGAVKDFTVTVDPGATYARFSLFDKDTTPGTDLDLEVYYNGSLVGASGGPTASEEVNLSNPLPGTYTVRVVGYATAASGSSFTLFSWALGSTAAGNMTVSAPATATTGQTGTIVIGTSGLSAGNRYLGSVVYGGTTGLPAPTIVRIDP